MSQFLIYLSSALIVLWTIQLARTKGRNPWIWGGASLVFMLVSFNESSLRLVGIAPLLFLLFFRTPQDEKSKSPPAPTTVTCPKCHTPQAAAQRFCIHCGWELGKAYNPDAAKDDKPATNPTSSKLEPVTSPHANHSSVDTKEAAEKPAEPQRKPIAGPAISRESGGSIAPEDAGAVDNENSSPPEPVEVLEEPSRVYSGPPTPERLTERGIDLLNQGKFREAIDQFTKALALNARYREALAQRATAYERLGMASQAEADRRILNAS